MEYGSQLNLAMFISKLAVKLVFAFTINP